MSLTEQHPRPTGSPKPGTNARGLIPGVVEFNRSLCREHFLLRIRVQGPMPETYPGQFVQLRCRAPNGPSPGVDEGDCTIEWPEDGSLASIRDELRGPVSLLRRPFSLAGRGDDEHGAWIELIHRVVGVGTAWMAALQPGDPVDLIGPLGNRFTSPPGKRTALLVGGGVGLPPMLYLAGYLQRQGIRAVAFVGATSVDLLAVTVSTGTAPSEEGRPTLCVEEFTKFGYPAVITTDDGSCGLKGRVTDAVRAYLVSETNLDPASTTLYTCGPEPMMRAAADLAERHDIDCQVCVEQTMACGIGTCQSCVVRIEDGRHPQDTTPDGRGWRYRLTCTDGPIFNSRQIVW